MSQIRDQIAAALAAKKQTAKELYASLKDAENEKQVVNALYNMRNAGLVERDDDGRYSLTGKVQMGRLSPASKRKVRAAVASLPKVRGTPPMPAVAAPRGGDLRRILADNVEHTQGALDEYVAVVADPAILEPLVAARNKARAALAAFDAKGE